MVNVIRLEEYLIAHNIKKVKLLKLDTQGSELLVLKGCGNKLKDIEYIVCKVSFFELYKGSPVWTEIIDFLRHFSFEVVLMDGFCFDVNGNLLQADILFRQTI